MRTFAPLLNSGSQTLDRIQLQLKSALDSITGSTYLQALAQNGVVGAPQWYNARDPKWGIHGDGRDDTSAIQNLLNVANAAGGGTVHFGAGTYAHTAAMGGVGFKNLLITGDGIDVTVFKDTRGPTQSGTPTTTTPFSSAFPGYAPFSFTNSSSIYIRDMTMQGPLLPGQLTGIGFGSGGGKAAFFRDCTTVGVFFCRATGQVNESLLADTTVSGTTDHVTFAFNRIDNNNLNALNVNSNRIRGATIVGNYVYNTWGSMVQCAAQSATIVGNGGVVGATGPTGSSPFVLDTGAFVLFAGNRCEYSNTSNTGACALAIFGGFATADSCVVVQDNVFKDILGAYEYNAGLLFGVIGINGAKGSVYIKDNVIDGCGRNPAIMGEGYAIGVVNGTAGAVVHIEGNHVNNSPGGSSTNITGLVRVASNVPAGIVTVGKNYSTGVNDILTVDGAGLATYDDASGKPNAILGDASITVDCALSVAGTFNASQFYVFAKTLTANRTVTVNTDSAVTDEVIEFYRYDATANTLTIANGGVGGGNCIVLPASKKRACRIKFDGTNWGLDAVWSLTP